MRIPNDKEKKKKTKEKLSALRLNVMHKKETPIITIPSEKSPPRHIISILLILLSQSMHISRRNN